MTREEFIKKLGYTPSITDEEWKDIEFVYTYHPAINEANGKQQIADIFSVGGMAVIRDMYGRAERAQTIEGCICNINSQILELQQKKAKFEEELNNLRNGCELED